MFIRGVTLNYARVSFQGLVSDPKATSIRVLREGILNTLGFFRKEREFLCLWISFSRGPFPKRTPLGLMAQVSLLVSGSVDTDNLTNPHSVSNNTQPAIHALY